MLADNFHRHLRLLPRSGAEALAALFSVSAFNVYIGDNLGIQW